MIGALVGLKARKNQRGYRRLPGAPRARAWRDCCHRSLTADEIILKTKKYLKIFRPEKIRSAHMV